jgi:predicted nucleic acid-binding Zn ribbon protein
MERAGRIFQKVKLPQEVAGPETRVRAVWARVAGKNVAAHTRAGALVRETLIVEVEDKIWQQQLSRLKHFLLSNLEKELGEKVVNDIDFRPMPPRREPQRAEHARGSFEGIEDPVLALLYQRSRRNAS